VAPAGVWNGLLRLNYIVAGSPGGADPHLLFRCLDVGWDDGRFCWKGRAAPITTSASMVEIMLERGLITDVEADRLLFGTLPNAEEAATDERLMLRALLQGCSFSPIYADNPLSNAPPRVAGYAMRTLSGSTTHVLDAREGLPMLDEEARNVLRRELSERRRS
jgi:hypothetical protein